MVHPLLGQDEFRLVNKCIGDAFGYEESACLLWIDSVSAPFARGNQKVEINEL